MGVTSRFGVDRRTRRLVVGGVTTGLLAGLVLVAGGGTASAAEADGGTASPTGQVTLFADANLQRPVFKHGYGTCLRPVRYPLTATVRSFDNRPAPGCQVVLTSGITSVVLCTGRGPVPSAVQLAPAVTIRPGSSPPCMAQTPGSATSTGGVVHRRH
jgi:hypothetical protein